MKARYYLQVGDYANALTHANQGIADASGSLMSFFSDNTGEYASWGMWVQIEQETIRGEKYFVDLLKSEPNDARLSEYFSPGPDANGEYLGLPFMIKHFTQILLIQMRKSLQQLSE